MENAIITLETAIKSTESKLDNMTWKLEEFEKGIINSVKHSNSIKMASVMELMHNISSMRDDYQALHQEIMEIDETNKEVKTNLTEQISIVHNEFSELKEVLRSRKQQ